MHYNKDTHKLNAQIITGYEAIQLRGLCKHKICNSFHFPYAETYYMLRFVQIRNNRYENRLIFLPLANTNIVLP
jgi:hypothetical protein